MIDDAVMNMDINVRVVFIETNIIKSAESRYLIFVISKKDIYALSNESVIIRFTSSAVADDCELLFRRTPISATKSAV